MDVHGSAAFGQALQVDGIHKSYRATKALSNVSLHANTGMIVGVAGENGSGKSTLLRIVAGLEQADQGSVNMSDVSVYDRQSARSAGVAIVTQEPCLVDSLTVAENVHLGRKDHQFLYSRIACRELAAHLDRELQFGVTLDTPAYALKPDQKQLVSIARALAQNPRVLILDESTSSLNDEQVERLFSVLKRRKDEGVITLFVSHRLKEMTYLCDTITVLRDGSFVREFPRSDFTEDSLVRAMVGRGIATGQTMRVSDFSETQVEFRNVTAAGLNNLECKIKKGTVTAFAGLTGCGGHEALQVLFGLQPYQGEILIDGRQENIRCPTDALRMGLALVPAERKHEAIFPNLSVHENAVVQLRSMHSLLRPVRTKREAEVSNQIVEQFRVKCTHPRSATITSLSGGNQQKVVIGRSLSIKPSIMLLDEPTRGIDIGARYEIYQLLRRLVDQGVTIVLASTDLMEILHLADEVIVLFRGTVKATLSGSEITEEAIGYHATGN